MSSINIYGTRKTQKFDRIGATSIELQNIKKKSHNTEKMKGGPLWFLTSELWNVVAELWKRYILTSELENVISELKSWLTTRLRTTNEQKSGPIALNWRKKLSHCNSRAFSSETISFGNFLSFYNSNFSQLRLSNFLQLTENFLLDVIVCQFQTKKNPFLKKKWMKLDQT